MLDIGFEIMHLSGGMYSLATTGGRQSVVVKKQESKLAADTEGVHHVLSDT